MKEYEYYDSLMRVIFQYRNSFSSYYPQLPFIVGETTGGYYGVDQGWERVNTQLRDLNKDSDKYTKCVKLMDLSHSGDYIHFSAQSQRIMGTRYFKQFRSMFETF